MPESPSRDKPLRRDAERNRQRILQAAQEMFSEHGLAVTLDDIARHAGLGVGTVYRRFNTKESLVEALFDGKMTDLANLAERALDEPEPWPALVRLLEQLCALQARDRGLRELVLGTHYGRQEVAMIRERLAPPLARLFAAAKASGHLRHDIQPQDVPVLLVMMGAAEDYSRDTRPDTWRRYLTLLLDGLAASRDTVTPLPVSPLTEKQLEQAMLSFRLPRV